MGRADAVLALAGLTNCQREVVLMKARGMTAAAIAADLVRTEDTVKSHLYAAYKRLGIKKSSQLVVLCTLAGYITTWKDAA